VVQLFELVTQHGGQTTIRAYMWGQLSSGSIFVGAYVAIVTVLGWCDLPLYPQPVDN
jgi:hypothetical protein